jgi:hypothetical protein
MSTGRSLQLTDSVKPSNKGEYTIDVDNRHTEEVKVIGDRHLAQGVRLRADRTHLCVPVHRPGTGQAPGCRYRCRQVVRQRVSPRPGLLPQDG